MINIKDNVNGTVIIVYPDKEVTIKKNQLYFNIEQSTNIVSFYNKNDDTVFLTVLISELKVDGLDVTKANVESKLSNIIFGESGGGSGDSYTKAEEDAKLSKKQNTLEAGENIVLSNLASGNVKIDATIPEANLYEIVDQLPTIGVKNLIYLIPEELSETNRYHEWLWLDGLWEDMGTFVDEIDLSGYYTKGEVDSSLEDIDDRLNENTIIAGDYISIFKSDSGTTINSKIFSLTQSQYDSITVKDPDTVYLIEKQ
ncbi:hypothetical protein EZS27_004646 [termite gut metagenome]|uniref:Minor tail protein gp31 C-terminal domain-containing protein n=1 Tax=termite gut metagenome TaxID=433724 RepID=A0A5J4SP86_9ZZZZ